MRALVVLVFFLGGCIVAGDDEAPRTRRGGEWFWYDVPVGQRCVPGDGGGSWRCGGGDSYCVADEFGRAGWCRRECGTLGPEYANYPCGPSDRYEQTWLDPGFGAVVCACLPSGAR